MPARSRPLALVALLAVLATGCAARQDAAAGQGFVAGDGSVQVVPPAQRQPAPPVAGETVAGGRLALADLEGPVVVNFWASWCGPCVKEAPALRNIAKAYAGRVSVVGVNVRDERAAARRFEQDFAVGYDSWFDQPAAIAASFGGIGPAALPSTILLDGRHRVAVRLLGSVDERRLSVHLDQLLAEAGSPPPG